MGGIPKPQGPVADYNTLWAYGGPYVFIKYLKGIFPFHIQNGKWESNNWDVQEQMGSLSSPVRRKRRCCPVLPIKLGWDCHSLVRHTTEVLPKERFEIQFWQ